MKKRTKFASLLLSAAMMVSLAGCGSAGNDNSQSSSGDKVYQIGICPLVQHDALDAATEGFKKALTDKL